MQSDSIRCSYCRLWIRRFHNCGKTCRADAAGTRLAVLERGAEWRPGDYPDTLGSVAKESRLKPLGFDRRSEQNPIGLYNIVQTNELMIVSGSGLGGCSLVNANVALMPDRETFMQPQWPFALQDRDALQPYYERAAYELGVQYDFIDRSNKMRAQRVAAERLRDIGCHFEAAGLTITRSNTLDLPVINRQGLYQRNCIDCGDCMIGCNVGAKNTLAMNYLPIARRHGAMLFTQCEVRRFYREYEHYVVEYLHHCKLPTGQVETTLRTVTTRILILSAGSLGSTEILLRSQDSGMCFSHALGKYWTANGDALGSWIIRNYVQARLVSALSMINKVLALLFKAISHIPCVQICMIVYLFKMVQLRMCTRRS